MRVLFRIPRWALFVGVPLLIAALGLAVWGIDTAMHGDKVARNVNLAGVSVGGLSEEEVTERVEALADRFTSTPVLISTADGDLSLTADELGMTVDVEATVAAINETGRGEGVAQPLSWLGSFGEAHSANVHFAIDGDTARDTLGAPDMLRTSASPPSVEFTDGSLEVVAGTPGQGIDVDDLLERLPAALQTDEVPIRIDANLVTVEAPPLPPAIDVAVAEANALIANEITVEVAGFQAQVDSETIASWFVVELDGDEPVVEIDAERILPSLESLLAPAAEQTGAATFDVVDGEVVIVAESGAEMCCAPNAPFIALRAVNRGLTDEPVVLPGRPAVAEEERERLEALGIVELVASETTEHPCCQSRVTNIQRFADLMRGAVILPGEAISLNDHVGRRTTENGFVPGGFISRGVLVQDIGGGVSQFATTIFNTAFFAGLDFDTYQAHSIYFSRYPFGREATISFPVPDLVIRNTTEYGILIWPRYTDTSITVDMYSTKHIDVVASEATVTWQAQCRRATTTRTRTYEDGTELIDSVFAVYRPSEGRNCDGSASDPSLTTTTTEATTTTGAPETTAGPSTPDTTAAPPPTTTAPATTAAPTTAAPTTAAPTTAAPTTTSP